MSGGTPVTLVLAAGVTLLLVLHYSSLPLQTWDEARNANNALEVAAAGIGWSPHTSVFPITGTPSPRW